MEGSSECGMDMESGSADECLREDINSLIHLDDNSSEIAYKITLEQNNIIVNKTPTSDTNLSNVSPANINLSDVSPANINLSNVNLDTINVSKINTAHINLSNVNLDSINMSNVSPANTNMSNVCLAHINISNVKEANTNMDKINTVPFSLNVEDYPFELSMSNGNKNTSNFNQQSGTQVLDLSTNNSNNSLTSSNKNNFMLTSYFQPFNQFNIDVNQPSTSKSNQDKNYLNFEENTNTDNLDNLTIITETDQPTSTVEFLKQATAKPKNIVMETTELEISLVENSASDDNLLKPTKPIEQNQNSDLSDSENKIKLFAEDTGPHWHNVQNNIVTAPVITGNLPKIFADFPIFGKPDKVRDRESFQDKMVRKYVGCDLDDAEYAELKDYCSIDNLKTGKELISNAKIPSVGPISGPLTEAQELAKEKEDIEEPNLYVLKKLKMRMKDDTQNAFNKKLKYRGCRIIPMNAEEEQSNIPDVEPTDLEPGKDILYKVRVYRPFIFMQPKVRARMRGRHSVFSCDMYMVGRQPLWTLRDRLVCRNDTDMRLDVAARPDIRAHTTCKDMFPSGFLFINNVFYVDRRAGCRDTSAVVRRWAKDRGLGDFPVRDMALRLQDISLKIAHPEVYVHQGNCEHVFLFSEIRLLSLNDPLHLTFYPCHTSVSQNQTIYCTTCAEYGAKWIVVECIRVPFDPAFFCDTCFRRFLYKDGKKIGDFKAYAYKGNELSILKHPTY